jgi:hypothetical protein
MQSHPNICSPVHETGKLFRKSLGLRFCHKFSVPNFGSKKVIDRALFNFKVSNLDHRDNKFLSEGVPYTYDQIANTSLCLKSVNNQIFYTKTILKAYPDLYFIGLSRNGYALADGLVRRGKTAAEAGKIYYRISEEMKRLSDHISRFKLIKFEEIIQQPFEKAKELFEFTNTKPSTLDKLRLKSKKVISRDGEHQVKFGNEHRKYWFDRSNINQILDPTINEKQMERMTTKMINEFNKEAKSAIEYYGYEKN